MTWEWDQSWNQFYYWVLVLFLLATFFFRVVSHETKDRAFTRMLSPRVVLLAISRQKLMREARWGMTIPTSHSTSSSNSSIASQALSCEKKRVRKQFRQFHSHERYAWEWDYDTALHSYVVFRTDLHTNTKVHRCVRVITIAIDREMYCVPKGYIYLIMSNKGSNHCHYFWDHRLK